MNKDYYLCNYCFNKVKQQKGTKIKMIFKIKGTHDILGEQACCWRRVQTYFHSFFGKYHFKEIRTPIIEYASVFNKAAEYSDMVSKETYTFLDKKNRPITLRPEGTAGIIRSYVENKLDKTDLLTKFYYYGPCFRYERPQKGRYRQFHQIGVEVLGITSPFLDVEIITLAYRFLKGLGFDNVDIKINSLGNQADYSFYLQTFSNYLQPYILQLCFLCQQRLKKNPLRIWDCKICGSKEFLKQAPRILLHLSQPSKQRFQQVLDGLKAMRINFEVCHDLVRGLDYYTHTVFEITTGSTVLGGGGCYDNLVAAFGGNNTSGIGFAIGMERLMLVLQDNGFCNHIVTHLDVFALILESCFFYQGLALINTLRHHGFAADLNYHFDSFAKNMKQALRHKPSYLLILGDQEFQKQQVTIKNTKTHIQTTILQKDIVAYFKQLGKKTSYEK